MTAGVVLCNFGEPAEPDRERVVSYLERIFLANASLEDADSDAAARERARDLAERRTPGLLAEYEAIGGSPLDAQARAQADALEEALAARGHDAAVAVAFQFTSPTIPGTVERLLADGADRVVGLPVYPLCGPSTTVAAIRELRTAVEAVDPSVPVDGIAGWHRHPTYNRLRAGNVARFADREGLDLSDPGTRLVFSAHGTPVRYLEAGSRYDRYVEEYCAAQARLLGVEGYDVGYQNHANRDVGWTEPDVEDVVAALDGDRVVVEPVSFVHEQSETLSELDGDLAGDAAATGLDFHRVPVPHDDERLVAVLADLVEPFAAGFDPGYYRLHECRCSGDAAAVCLNAPIPSR